MNQSELRLGLSRALEALGDRWSLEVLRLASESPRTFSDFSGALELTDTVLSKRLSHLHERGLLDRAAYSERPLRWRYAATDRTLDLWKPRLATWRWDRTWVPRADAHRVQVVHATCGKSVVPAFGCGACEAIGLTPHDVRSELTEQLRAELNHPASKRITRLAARPHIDAISLLGDSWSVALLGSVLLGNRSFSELRRILGTISTATLSEKLQRFVAVELLVREAPDGQRRAHYRATPKTLDFFPIFATLIEWSRDWADPVGMRFIHTQCDSELLPRYTCNSCNRAMRRSTTLFVTTPLPTTA